MKTFKRNMMGVIGACLLAVSVSSLAATADPEATHQAYDAARQALDRANYKEARAIYEEIARAGGPRAEEAWYWKAYSESKLGDGQAVLRSLAELRRLYPDSKWIDDAEALEYEIRPRDPSDELPENEELKLYALQALVVSDPDRAVPIIKRYLEEGKSDQLKERALFLLLQADTDAARGILADTALAGGPAMLKFSAIRTLGMIGDEEALDILDRVYRQDVDNNTRHMIINAYMMAGEADRIKGIMDSTKDETLRVQAIQMLGVMGETDYLKALYPKAKSPESRRIIVQAMAMGGDGEFLMSILENEKDTDIRIMAIQSLMMADVSGVENRLMELYAESEVKEEKHVIVQALAMQGASDSLKALFAKETDKDLKRQILQSMAMFMDEEDTSDFFLEILEED